jgi:hypothetical protein
MLSGVRLNPLGIAATTGLLYQPQMTDDGHCGARLIAETEVLRENLPHRHYAHHKSWSFPIKNYLKHEDAS